MKKIETESLHINETAFPSPWKQQLEFSAPARGTWNIVHTGMLIPESHQIFVCAKGCLRGVVLTAAEMGEMGRYSALEIKEENVLNGDMEQMMVEGVSDIIDKLSYRPRAIELFISCQHFFLAYDQGVVFETLRERFPDIEFVDCYMIPTLRKSGITPDQRMRVQLYRMLKKKPVNLRRINHIGSNHRISRLSEIYEIARDNDYELSSIHDAGSFDEYLGMAEACLNIVTEPIAIKAGEDMLERLGIPFIYLPNVFRPDDIEEVYERLHMRTDKLSEYRRNAEYEIELARKELGDKEIVIDYTFTFRTLNLARFLLENGFNVTDIYIDSFLPEEETDWSWLKENHPDLVIHPTNRPSMRFEGAGREDALALGQKAACFAGTDHFVNITEGGGLFGFAGIAELMEMMRIAACEKKDRRALVQKKGSGLRSILDESSSLCCASSLTHGASSSGNSASASLVPTYSSDEFGACSALYELGGMVVMHDASGCNSTYTTHDEPRWYDHPSMIYISAISEMEAIMGDDDKLIRDIEDAAEELKPEFIAIIGAPIPYMTGIDLEAIASILEQRLGIPAFGIRANGMNDYTAGIEMALSSLAERIKAGSSEAKGDNDRPKVNILGLTPLDYPGKTTLSSIEGWLEECGLALGCTFTMNSSLDDIKGSSDADVNLVVSSGAIKTARSMKERFGIPYVIGAPFGRGYAGELGHMLRSAAAGDAPDSEDEALDCPAEAVIIGEAVTSVSLARALKRDYGIEASVISAVSGGSEVLRSFDTEALSEDAVMAALEAARPKLVIADPFYQAIVREEVRFVALPHEAFSGRIFDNEVPDLINRDIREALRLGEINA
ncbi:MAG: nitrogenase component 1 [Anaerovoracaceae bacterium]